MDIRKLYDTGISFDVFVNRDMDSYREKALEILNKIEFDQEYEEKVKGINKDIYILICAEMWCPDCMINVPVVEKLREYNEKIKISIVGKSGNEELIRNYIKTDNVKIPTFIIFDENFKELGSFVEHPKKIKDIISRGNQPNIIVAMRKYRKGEYTQETLKDILEVIR